MSKTIRPACPGFIQRFRGGLLRTRSDDAGGAVIEFAFIAPTLIALLAAVADFAIMVVVSVLMEGGVREAARFGMTGGECPTTSREDYIVSIIDKHTMGLVDITTDDVEVLIYDDFESVDSGDALTLDVNGNGDWDEDDGDTYIDRNGNGAWDPDPGVPGAGQGEAIVLYRVETAWQALTPIVAPFLGADGAITLSASIVIRNEPFGAAGSSLSECN